LRAAAAVPKDGGILSPSWLCCEYAAWLAALPDSLQESALAEALQAICDLDLDELQAIDLPRGFGRD